MFYSEVVDDQGYTPIGATGKSNFQIPLSKLTTSNLVPVDLEYNPELHIPKLLFSNTIPTTNTFYDHQDN